MPNPMQSEPVACPICGDAPKWRGTRSDYARGLFRLQCLGETHLVQSYGPTEAAAIAAWNRRPSPQGEAQGLVERISLPIVDQHGKQIGTAEMTPAEHGRIEAYVDEDGTAWTPATGWAYRQVCKAREQAAALITAQAAEIKASTSLLDEVLDALAALVLNIDAGGATVGAMQDARTILARIRSKPNG